MWNLLGLLPDSWKFAIVAAGLLSMGFTAGKVSADWLGNKALLDEVHQLRITTQESVCIAVAQLRKGDWTACLLAPPSLP